MCLILFAHNAHPDYPLVVAANRDEFYARPTDSAGFWKQPSDLLAGRDRQAGGTWLGITRAGRFAAITNYREGEYSDSRHSRGQLTLDYLASGVSPTEYIQQLEQRADQYRGFNLLLGRPGELHYFGNRAGPQERLGDGLYALGNGVLRDSWQKMRQGKRALRQVLQESLGPESLLRVMRDESRPDDSRLPDTGVGLELERLLSARFIRGEQYGTRATSVILVSHTGEVRFLEQNFNHTGKDGALRDYRFDLKTQIQ